MWKRLQRSLTSGMIPTAGAFTVPTIKAALFLGFTLIGGIWLFAGYYFTARMAELEQRRRQSTRGTCVPRIC